jgi:hypothetical protein
MDKVESSYRQAHHTNKTHRSHQMLKIGPYALSTFLAPIQLAHIHVVQFFSGNTAHISNPDLLCNVTYTARKVLLFFIWNCNIVKFASLLIVLTGIIHKQLFHCIILIQHFDKKNIMNDCLIQQNRLRF